MALVKVYCLTGAALDWAVAKADQPVYSDAALIKSLTAGSNGIGMEWEAFSPSTNGDQANTFIEREGIRTERGNDLIFPRGNEKGEFSEPLWLASVGNGQVLHGRTMLEAAMRCFVNLKLGPELEVPQGLLK